jgi:hypothetical protein
MAQARHPLPAAPQKPFPLVDGERAPTPVNPPQPAAAPRVSAAGTFDEPADDSVEVVCRWRSDDSALNIARIIREHLSPFSKLSQVSFEPTHLVAEDRRERTGHGKAATP